MHPANVPISQIAETQATPHTPGTPTGNSGFGHEKEGKIPNKTGRFLSKIAHFRAKLKKKVPSLDKIDLAFNQNTRPLCDPNPYPQSIKYCTPEKAKEGKKARASKHRLCKSEFAKCGEAYPAERTQAVNILGHVQNHPRTTWSDYYLPGGNGTVWMQHSSNNLAPGEHH
jgi:hypothetical protein